MARSGSAQARPMGLGGLLVIIIPFVFLVLFFLVPFLIVVRISLSEAAQALPPYEPVFEGFSQLGAFLGRLGFGNFALIFSDDLYWATYLNSLRIAATATVITLLIGYPVAYAMAAAPRRIQTALVVLVILPFWTSFLIRVYAWIGILKPEGLLSEALLALGLISEPLRLLNTDAAVLIGIVYSYLPFMVLPLYAALEKLDDTLLEAASDLGSPPWKSFLTITFPLSLPGVAAGCALVFIPAVGEFVIPDLLGGPDTLMIGHVLWTEFFSNRDWPLSSAVAVLLLLVLVVPILAFQRFQASSARAGESRS